jgi:hypothetical protein
LAENVFGGFQKHFPHTHTILEIFLQTEKQFVKILKFTDSKSVYKFSFLGDISEKK